MDISRYFLILDFDEVSNTPLINIGISTHIEKYPNHSSVLNKDQSI